jgi:hypothetical protein
MTDFIQIAMGASFVGAVWMLSKVYQRYNDKATANKKTHYLQDLQTPLDPIQKVPPTKEASPRKITADFRQFQKPLPFGFGLKLFDPRTKTI